VVIGFLIPAVLHKKIVPLFFSLIVWGKAVVFIFNCGFFFSPASIANNKRWNKK